MRLIRFLLSFLLVLYSMTPTFAIDRTAYEEKISDDLTIEYIIEKMPESRLANSVTGKKTAKAKNGDTVLWTVTVTGTFEYDGTRSICTAALVSTTCPSSYWVLSNKTSTKMGSTAKASADGTKYVNGLATDKQTVTVFLTCGIDGTLY